MTQRPLTRKSRTKMSDNGQVSQVWHDNADALAKWSLRRLVNRRDVFGLYKPTGATTMKVPLRDEFLLGHFKSKSTLGLHSASAASTSKWTCLDIDCHTDDRVQAGYNLSWCQKAVRALKADFGIEGLLFSSDGRGSYHLLLPFAEPVPTADAHGFGVWFASQHADIMVSVETFPKQSSIANGDYGSWLRLLGRHHSREHWHTLWDPSKGWLSAEETVKVVLAHEGCDPAAVLDQENRLPAIDDVVTVPSDVKLEPSDRTRDIIDNPPEPGDRNQKLFEAACDLAGRGHDEVEIREQLMPTFRLTGLSPQEVIRTIKSACDKPRDPSLGDEDVQFDSSRFTGLISQSKAESPVEATETADTDSDAVPLPKGFSWVAITDLEGPATPEYLWEKYLARGCVSLLTGRWKTGKSTLLGYLMAAMEKGGDLGSRVEPARVLVVSEEPTVVLKGRQEALGIGGHVAYVQTPYFGKPSQGQWEDLLLFLLHAVVVDGFDVVVLDSLAEAWAVRKENDAVGCREAFSRLKVLQEAGAAILVLHHPAKAIGADNEPVARGSGDILAYPDILISLSPDGPGETNRRILRCVGRFERPEDRVLELRDDGYHQVGTGRSATPDARMVMVLNAVPAHPPGITAKALHKSQEKGEVQLSLRAVQKYLKRANARGDIFATEGSERGKPTHYYSEETP